ncbi:hypothetical protein OROMI_016489 [Orobanche minor]
MALCPADFEKNISDSISSEKPKNMNPENPNSGAVDPDLASTSSVPTKPIGDGKVTAIPNTSSQPDPKAQASKSSSNPSADLAQATITSLANQISANILKYSPVDQSGGGPPENSAPVIPSFNSSAPSDSVGVGDDPLLKDGSSSSAKGATSTTMAGNDLSAATLGAKSFSAIIAGVPVSEKKLGTVDLTTSNPTVIFTKDECDQVSSFYRFAIIGKFTYGKPPNHLIVQQLKSDGFGLCKVHFLNGKHILINLSSQAFCDKLRMRREIPFNGFPMRVFRWDPFFNFKEEAAIVPLWVKIHALPPQWFDLRSLETIASSVGVFLKADDLTYNRSRLSFARVCVEVNLKNLLHDKLIYNILDMIFIHVI